MASVQCFKKAEKSYYQQNRRGQRSENAKSHAEWYGQREDHFSLHRGSTAEGYGYSAKGHGDMARAQGLGHKVQAEIVYKTELSIKGQIVCKGRNKGRYLSQSDQNHSRGQSNGRYLQQAQTQSKTEFRGNQREFSSCQAKAKEKTEHRKKEQAQTQSMTEFRGNQREFSSCQAKAKKKIEHGKKEKFMMMNREFRTRDNRRSDRSGSGSESESESENESESDSESDSETETESESESETESESESETDNGRYLQRPQTQSMTEFRGNQRKFSSCQAKAKKKTEHRKKEQAQTQSMTEFRGKQREFSSCQAKAKKKTEHSKKEKFMMMHREFKTRDNRCSDGSESESESDNDRW